MDEIKPEVGIRGILVIQGLDLEAMSPRGAVPCA